MCVKISLMQRDMKEMMAELGLDSMLCRCCIYEVVENVFNSRLDLQNFLIYMCTVDATYLLI